MLIHAFGEELKVLHVDSREKHEIIQCYSLQEKRQYLLLHYVEYEQVKRLLPYYFSLMDNDVFEDYKGCFAENGELYLAFYKGYGEPLKDLLQKGILSLERRIRIGRRLLEKILLWKLPCGIAGQILAAERILMDGEELAFNYAWEGAVETEDDICLFAERMSDLTETLFRQEIRDGAETKLTEFLTELKQGKMTTILHIYEEYCSMCVHLTGECAEKITLTAPISKTKMRCRVTKDAYFHFRRYYIRKKIIYCLVIVIILLPILTGAYILPYLQDNYFPKWVTKVMPVNDEERFSYTGKVKLTDETGERVLFIGRLTEGRIQGMGKLYDYEGNLLYQGEFENDQYAGNGTLYYENGNLCYEGSFAEGNYEGQGKLYDEGGELHYEGAFVGGKCEGEGKLYHTENGKLCYEGTFAGGQYEGQGKLYNTENGKLCYEGTFAGGQYEGQGKLYNTENGELRYEGTFADGKYEGQGKLYNRKNGNLQYEGAFADGKYEGEGKLYVSKSGHVLYEGGFLQGSFYGEGKLYDRKTQTKVYEGGFRYGKYDGYGTEYSIDGFMIYGGNFRLGFYHGGGILYDPESGEIIAEGEFRNGELIPREEEETTETETTEDEQENKKKDKKKTDKKKTDGEEQ